MMAGCEARAKQELRSLIGSKEAQERGHRRAKRRRRTERKGEGRRCKTTRGSVTRDASTPSSPWILRGFAGTGAA